MSLQKSLPRIAAQVLQNTHVGLSKMKEKFELIELAYGKSAVEADFRVWCQEVKEEHPRYPLTDYVKVVDKRLGPQFATPGINVKDPRISEISSATYERTGFLPAVRSVAALLVDFSPEDILGAMNEFAGTLEEKDFKSAMRTFFADGGASAVIIARKRRK